MAFSRGRIRPSWFNIWHLPPLVDEYDEEGLSESVTTIESVILQEVHNGIAPNRIFLAGFSQGAALCLVTALNTLHDIGGIGSFSGWIPHRTRDVGVC